MIKYQPIGQSFLLHISCCLVSPTHGFPPYCGSGLLQRRDLSRIPPPQVTVQADHGDQGPHWPFTKICRKERKRNVLGTTFCASYNNHLLRSLTVFHYTHRGRKTLAKPSTEIAIFQKQTSK